MTTITANTEKYSITDTGTAYNIETPLEVIQVLEDARLNRTRLKIYLGDNKTGRDWYEEHERFCYVGRSNGEYKVPLAISKSNSRGGGCLLDSSIVKISRVSDGKVLYQHPKYKAPKIEIKEESNVPSDFGYTHTLYISGKVYSNHKSLKSAQRLKSILS